MVQGRLWPRVSIGGVILPGISQRFSWSGRSAKHYQAFAPGVVRSAIPTRHCCAARTKLLAARSRLIRGPKRSRRVVNLSRLRKGRPNPLTIEALAASVDATIPIIISDQASCDIS